MTETSLCGAHSSCIYIPRYDLIEWICQVNVDTKLCVRSVRGHCASVWTGLWALQYHTVNIYRVFDLEQLIYSTYYSRFAVESSWNVMANGDAREENWRGNWRMEWVASTLHTTSEHGVSSITTADAHTSAASSRLNWRPPADLNGLVRFARKTKSGFCACAITFQTRSTSAAYPEAKITHGSLFTSALYIHICVPKEQ